MFTGSNVFLILGVALFVTALIAFPTRVEFLDQQAPGHSETYTIGWLFAPILGAWGLASLAIGLVQSPRRRFRTELLLLLLSAVVCVGLAFASFMVVVYGWGIMASVGQGEPLFLVYFALVLAPSAIVLASTVKFIRAGGRAIFQVGKNMKATVFAVLAAVPLTYSLVFLTYVYIL